MDRVEKKMQAAFFKTEQGTEPVRNWLKGLSKEDRLAIGTDIKTVEFGWPIGMPVCRPMGDSLFEVRTKLQKRIARILFSIEGGQMVLLHGFIKKAQKTPKADLDLAEYENAKLSKRTKIMARKKRLKKQNPRIGSPLDELLEEDGLLGEATANAAKRVLAWHVVQEMEKLGMSKTELARRMNTSRAALERLLDPDNTSITLSTINRAATALGKRIRLEFVDAA